LRGGAGERLSVLSFHSMSIDLVPQALESVLRVYPGLKVSIGTKSSSDQLADVMRMTADVGIAGNLPEMAEIEAISLGRDSIVAVMRADHPLAQTPVVRFCDLAVLPLVSSPIDSPIGTKLQEGFARHGKVFRPAVEAAAPTPIMQLVRRLGQIGLVGIQAVDSLKDMDGLAVRPLEAPVKYEMQAFWNRNSAPSPARDLFVQKLAAAYRRGRLVP
jgi:DNA-binding transcriptional LysR family regulator